MFYIKPKCVTARVPISVFKPTKGI